MPAPRRMRRMPRIREPRSRFLMECSHGAPCEPLPTKSTHPTSQRQSAPRTRSSLRQGRGVETHHDVASTSRPEPDHRINRIALLNARRSVTPCFQRAQFRISHPLFPLSPSQPPRIL
jgi:hypothetical protein